jgi:hypothetical protein
LQLRGLAAIPRLDSLLCDRQIMLAVQVLGTFGGRAAKAIPDYIWGGKILEVKTSWGAFKPKQAAVLAQYAVREKKQLIYLFYKRPTDAQLEKIQSIVRQEAGDNVPLVVNYLFE